MVGANYGQREAKKGSKTQLPVLRCQEQNTASYTQHHQGWADNPSHPSGPNHRSIPIFTPFKEPSPPPTPHPAPRERAREPVACSQSPCCSTSFSKASPKFLFWSLVNFYWLIYGLNCPRTLVSNMSFKYIQFIFLAFFLRLHPWNVEVLRLGIESEL